MVPFFFLHSFICLRKKSIWNCICDAQFWMSFALNLRQPIEIAIEKKIHRKTSINFRFHSIFFLGSCELCFTCIAILRVIVVRCLALWIGILYRPQLYHVQKLYMTKFKRLSSQSYQWMCMYNWTECYICIRYMYFAEDCSSCIIRFLEQSFRPKKAAKNILKLSWFKWWY